MPDHPFARSVAEKTANKSGWPNNENDRPLAKNRLITVMVEQRGIEPLTSALRMGFSRFY